MKAEWLRVLKRRTARYNPWPKSLYYKEFRKLRKAKDKFKLNKTPREKNVIVSLTSHGKRLKTVDIAIMSILYQTTPPDRIILYLGSDVKPKDVPKRVYRLQKYGLEIEFKPEDLRPHKKYFYAVQDFPNDIIVTIDDDFLLPKNLIENLMEEHQKYPNAVITARAKEVLFDNDGKILPYNKWKHEVHAYKNGSSMKYLATGCGGVLYPPRAIDPSFLDKELIKKLSYGTDDLWLKVAEIKTKTPVKLIREDIYKSALELPTSAEESLWSENCSANDVNLKKIIEYFHITADDFVDEDV